MRIRPLPDASELNSEISERIHMPRVLGGMLVMIEPVPENGPVSLPMPEKTPRVIATKTKPPLESGRI